MIGQIIREYGQRLEVEADRSIYMCFPRKNLESIVIGDYVRFDFDLTTQQGVITERLPRKNILCRSDRYHPVKEMAANIDQIIVMIAVVPKPNEFYLDQYLVAAELLGVPAVIVCNKVDLERDVMLNQLCAFYQNLGYTIIYLSTKTGEGLGILIEQLKDKTSFLLGVSGVGKSSLINALIGEKVARVNLISAANEKGQHTTSVSRLYHLPCSGSIIDVPGIRELNLPLDLRKNILKGFIEFRPLIGQCRFRNCSHRNDPGCVIVEKVNQGELNPSRLKNYYRMCDGS